MSKEFDTISLDIKNHVAQIRLTRPQGANAVNALFAKEFVDCMNEIEYDDSVRCVAVLAEGKVFCAGGDLKEFHSQKDRLAQHGAAMLVNFHGAISKMHSMAKPVIAGVAGAAGGAGLSLVSAFDLVISSDKAKYTMAYTKAAMTPDGTSSYFLARHIGLRRAMELTLLNRVLDAETAYQWGLVNQVVPVEELEASTIALAEQLAEGPVFATGKAKQVIYHGYEATLETAAAFEAATIGQAMATADGQEGIAAFLERRDPIWTTGR